MWTGIFSLSECEFTERVLFLALSSFKTDNIQLLFLHSTDKSL